MNIRDRIIQIPINGPVRYGQIRGLFPRTYLIEWDNLVVEEIPVGEVALRSIWVVGKEPDARRLEHARSGDLEALVRSLTA